MKEKNRTWGKWYLKGLAFLATGIFTSMAAGLSVMAQTELTFTEKLTIEEVRELSEPEKDYEDENVYDYENEDEEEVEDKKIFGRKNNNKVVNMPQAQGQAIKMVISQPTTFEQSDEICSFLKEKKSVIVNLEYVNKDVARRIVDFISGGVYALDGYIQKVSNSIFLVAPSNYEITNEMAREEMKNKLSVSWLKNNNVNN